MALAPHAIPPPSILSSPTHTLNQNDDLCLTWLVHWNAVMSFSDYDGDIKSQGSRLLQLHPWKRATTNGNDKDDHKNSTTFLPCCIHSFYKKNLIWAILQSCSALIAFSNFSMQNTLDYGWFQLGWIDCGTLEQEMISYIFWFLIGTPGNLESLAPL